jgi:hypothetical protein
MRGYPISLDNSKISSLQFADAFLGCLSLSFVSNSLNFCLFSTSSIELKGVPKIGIFAFDKACMRLSGVCPPS